MSTIISATKSTKAAKQHTCDLCGQKIHEGETYLKSTHADSGDIYDFKMHNHCNYLVEKLNMWDGCDEGLDNEAFINYIDDAYGKLVHSLFVEPAMVSKFSRVMSINRYNEIVGMMKMAPFPKKVGFMFRYWEDKDAQNLEMHNEQLKMNIESEQRLKPLRVHKTGIASNEQTLFWTHFGYEIAIIKFEYPEDGCCLIELRSGNYCGETILIPKNQTIAYSVLAVEAYRIKYGYEKKFSEVF